MIKKSYIYILKNYTYTPFSNHKGTISEIKSKVVEIPSRSWWISTHIICGVLQNGIGGNESDFNRKSF